MSNPPFSVASISTGRNKTTILTRAERTFYAVEGARCVVEGGMHELLSQWLQSASGEELASSLGVDENRISNLRLPLEIPIGRGGKRTGDWREFQPVTLPTNQIKLVGSERSAILIVSSKSTVWSVVPETQIIYESRLKVAITE